MKLIQYTAYTLIVIASFLIILPYQQFRLQQIQNERLLNKYSNNNFISDEVGLPEGTTKSNDSVLSNTIDSLVEKNLISSNLNETYKAIKNRKHQVDQYNVIGVLEIKNLNLRSVILDYTSDETLGVAITAYAGEKNEIGNFVLAGHNYKNGFAFGNLKHVKEGDVITVDTINYKVFDIFVVKPNEVQKVVNQNTNYEKWVTLFTCTNNGKDRLVVRAKQFNF